MSEISDRLRIVMTWGHVPYNVRKMNGEAADLIDQQAETIARLTRMHDDMSAVAESNAKLASERAARIAKLEEFFLKLESALSDEEFARIKGGVWVSISQALADKEAAR